MYISSANNTQPQAVNDTARDIDGADIKNDEEQSNLITAEAGDGKEEENNTSTAL